MSMRKINFEEVTYEMARPATKLQILIWLLTNGRKGKLFIKKSESFRLYTIGHVNCRCATSPIKDDNA
jgi:hypothetical protein